MTWVNKLRAKAELTERVAKALGEDVSSRAVAIAVETAQESVQTEPPTPEAVALPPLVACPVCGTRVSIGQSCRVCGWRQAED